MVTICLQCGDKGFSNALVYCVKCLNFAVHRYCLDKLPEKFDEFVDWTCDGCEFELPKELTSPKSNPIQFEGRHHTSSKDVDGPLIVKGKRKKKRHKRIGTLLLAEESKKSPSKQPQDAELAANSPLSKAFKKKEGSCSAARVEDHRLRPVEPSTELKLLEKCDRAHDGRNHTSPRGVEGQRMVLASKEKKRKRRPQHRVGKEKSSAFFAEEAKQRLGSSPSRKPQDAELPTCSPPSTELNKKDTSCSSAQVENHRLRPGKANTDLDLTEKSNRTHKSATSSPSLTELHKKEASCSAAQVENHRVRPGEAKTELDLTEKIKRAHELSSLEKFKEKKMEKCSAASLSEQGAKECLEASQLTLVHAENDSTLDNHEPAQPVVEPIWRGGFCILNKDYDAFDGLVAHLSNKACQTRKVYEEANSIPSLLDLEMYPKSDVWPKSFETSGPSDDNIALYFFPLQKRYERLFDYLVQEMMHKGLALRAILKNSELLVFSSIELPLEYWRFQGKHYLWGVFRGKQGSSSLAMGHHEAITEGTKLVRTKSFYAGSPLSPLSNGGSFG